MEDAMTWFGDAWDGMEVAFPACDGQPSTTWILGAKLAKDKYALTPAWYPQDRCGPNCAWVPFSCTQVGTSGPEHVIKVHMQIPRMGTMSDRVASRAKQARTKLSAKARKELEALENLTRQGSQSTPTLVNFTQTTQDNDGWVPGGFILFLLMTKCPGTPIEKFQLKPDAEREKIRKAFEVAYKDCYRCGVIPADNSHDNLLWDSATETFHFVDFKWWVPASPENQWSDMTARYWCLQDFKKRKDGGFHMP
ncbi:hypothetical protein F5884DRAFT_430267 [Xylogone sp. PMI_703]|nr:hypothetical protein F5884DRAFT_430267 [Xylogone sp. PMI_703]